MATTTTATDATTTTTKMEVDADANEEGKQAPETTTSDKKKTTVIVEGSTKMEFPSDEASNVFYNPVQVQNRDLSTLMISLYTERRAVRRQLKLKKQELVQDYKNQNNGKRPNKEGNEAIQKQVDEYEKELNGKDLVQQQQQKDDHNGVTILDALAASGLRSIRYWKEIPGIRHITINDLENEAVERAFNNIEINGLTNVLVQNNGQQQEEEQRPFGINVQQCDATMEMYSSRRSSSSSPPQQPPPQQQKELYVQKPKYDIIDLDPYGSVAPFLDGALQAVEDGGMLNITCTDMAALGGSHPETCYGRYGSMPIQQSQYLHELALRILLKFVAENAARYGKTIKPILSVGMDFYVRVFVEVYDQKADVTKLSLNIGSVYQSVQCPSFHVVPHGKTAGKNNNVYQAARAPLIPQCEETGASFKVAGPVWLGPLHDPDVVATAIDRLQQLPDVQPQQQEQENSKSETRIPEQQQAKLQTKERLLGLLLNVSEELPDAPLYYVLPKLCKPLRIPQPPTNSFKAAIMNAGYRVSGFHKEPQAIKTDAPNSVIWDILRVWYYQQRPNEKRIAAPKKEEEDQSDKIDKSQKEEETKKESDDGKNDQNKKNDTNHKTNKRKAKNQKTNPVAEKILSVEPKIKVDFTIPRCLAKKISQQKKNLKKDKYGNNDKIDKSIKIKAVARFPQNPKPNWGPKPKARTTTKNKNDDDGNKIGTKDDDDDNQSENKNNDDKNGENDGRVHKKRKVDE